MFVAISMTMLNKSEPSLYVHATPSSSSAVCQTDASFTRLSPWRCQFHV